MKEALDKKYGSEKADQIIKSLDVKIKDIKDGFAAGFQVKNPEMTREQAEQSAQDDLSKMFQKKEVDPPSLLKNLNKTLKKG